MATVKRQNSGVEFDFRVDPPLKSYQFRLSRFTNGISDWRGCWPAIGELFKRQMVEQFVSEGKATGSRWASLSPAYKAWKDAHYPGRPIGVRTGKLEMAMTGGGGWAEHHDKDSAWFGMSDNAEAAPYGPHFAKRRPVVRAVGKHGREYQKVMHAWLVAERGKAMGQNVTGGDSLAGMVRSGGVTRMDWSGL